MKIKEWVMVLDGEWECPDCKGEWITSKGRDYYTKSCPTCQMGTITEKRVRFSLWEGDKPNYFTPEMASAMIEDVTGEKWEWSEDTAVYWRLAYTSGDRTTWEKKTYSGHVLQYLKFPEEYDVLMDFPGQSCPDSQWRL